MFFFPRSLSCRRALACALLSLCGCDKLFGTSVPDPATLGQQSDGGGDLMLRSGQVRGQICVLLSLRDYATCSTAYPHGSIMLHVQETATDGQAADDGSFSLDLVAAPPQVTVVARDIRGALVPAAVILPLSAAAAAVPMVPLEQQQQFRLTGAPLAKDRGVLLAYVANGGGQPVAGVQVRVTAADTRFIGPFVFAGGETLIGGATTATDQSGFLAVFELPPGRVALTLSGAVSGTRNTVAVAGANTFTLLQ